MKDGVLDGPWRGDITDVIFLKPLLPLVHSIYRDTNFFWHKCEIIVATTYKAYLIEVSGEKMTKVAETLNKMGCAWELNFEDHCIYFVPEESRYESTLKSRETFGYDEELRRVVRLT